MHDRFRKKKKIKTINYNIITNILWEIINVVILIDAVQKTHRVLRRFTAATDDEFAYVEKVSYYT